REAEVVDLKDYVQVNERIDAFYAKYPEGSIQSEIVELTESRVTVKAWAYRTPDDRCPGVGHSFMNIPGSTSFTRGSELETTETSAWGRALAALGFEVKRGIASAQEVENKRQEPAFDWWKAIGDGAKDWNLNSDLLTDFLGGTKAQLKTRAAA